MVKSLPVVQQVHGDSGVSVGKRDSLQTLFRFEVLPNATDDRDRWQRDTRLKLLSGIRFQRPFRTNILRIPMAQLKVIGLGRKADDPQPSDPRGENRGTMSRCRGYVRATGRNPD